MSTFLFAYGLSFDDASLLLNLFPVSYILLAEVYNNLKYVGLQQLIVVKFFFRNNGSVMAIQSIFRP